MNKRIKVLIGGVGLAGALAAGTGMAVAGGGQNDNGRDGREGPDRPIPAAALGRASAAALKHTGGGRVTDTEVGDEESYYEVEVTLANGKEVDVQLNRSFKVVGDDGGKPKERGDGDGKGNGNGNGNNGD